MANLEGGASEVQFHQKIKNGTSSVILAYVTFTGTLQAAGAKAEASRGLVSSNCGAVQQAGECSRLCRDVPQVGTLSVDACCSDFGREM